jgi:MoxR-like ATPase
MAHDSSFDVSAERLRAFFDELNGRFVERDDVLRQVVLALLSKEHCLLTGPPGTAKSGIASSVLGRILDESTGAPSLFAKQFTESTVQTDLVGPIDFKTLMQTGRTEHFTDQGMLGAVHAFIDEVLDGRDMLLRTTLNLLHERELKEGTQIRHGLIECALMTTNRYLAEVLESSRESLLAFVDRIAFVSFIPKGFATQNALGTVLRAQVGGVRAPKLKSLLTIQDLDVLQAAVDEVFLDDTLCGYLESILDAFETELSAATRADPSFVPTRYLSTRTAVRSGKILRAACVFDHIFREKRNAFEVDVLDFRLLRLTLLLSGPPPEHLEALLKKESDPRERRQLTIMRTEREIWERVIARVPKPTRTPRAKGKSKPSEDLAALGRIAAEAKGTASTTVVMETAAKLAAVADSAAPDSRAAKDLLDSMLASFAERAVRSGLLAGTGPEPAVLKVAQELADTAHALEKAAGTARPLSRWLRGRAVSMLDDALAFSSGTVPSLDLTEERSLGAHEEAATRVLQHVEGLMQARSKLVAEGADPSPAGTSLATNPGIERMIDEISAIMDRGFLHTAADALARPDGELAVLLGALDPTIASLTRLGERVAALGGDAHALKARVLGPRLKPLLAASFERVDARSRTDFVKQVDGLLKQLRDAGLERALDPGDMLHLVASSLATKERATLPKGAFPPDRDGYRALRAAERRTPLGYTLSLVAMSLGGPKPTLEQPPDEALATFTQQVRKLDPELRDALVALDLGRVERALEVLEAFWERLDKDMAQALGSDRDDEICACYDRILASQFFMIVRDEESLLRFQAEVRLSAETFAASPERVAALGQRMRRLEQVSSEGLSTLRKRRATALWNRASAS